MSGLDALVFCGGIGENSAYIRRRVCEDLHWIGIDVDEARNARAETLISAAASRAKVFVIKTDEEAAIAKHTQELYRRLRWGGKASLKNNCVVWRRSFVRPQGAYPQALM